MFRVEELKDDSPYLVATERLYHATQKPDERIPWAWIVRSIKAPSDPARGGRHLLIAAEGDDVLGFAYGMQLPGFGGHVSYVGVEERARSQGVGTRLMRQLFLELGADANKTGEPLPFVVWESHKPDVRHGTEADWKLWNARLRLFERLGAIWLDGLEILTPNFNDPEGEPVPLQLFVKPIDEPATDFDADRLFQIADGLMERIYKVRPPERLDTEKNRRSGSNRKTVKSSPG